MYTFLYSVPYSVILGPAEEGGKSKVKKLFNTEVTLIEICIIKTEQNSFSCKLTMASVLMLDWPSCEIKDVFNCNV